MDRSMNANFTSCEADARYAGVPGGGQRHPPVRRPPPSREPQEPEIEDPEDETPVSDPPPPGRSRTPVEEPPKPGRGHAQRDAARHA